VFETWSGPSGRSSSYWDMSLKVILGNFLLFLSLDSWLWVSLLGYLLFRYRFKAIRPGHYGLKSYFFFHAPRFFFIVALFRKMKKRKRCHCPIVKLWRKWVSLYNEYCPEVKMNYLIYLSLYVYLSAYLSIIIIYPSIHLPTYLPTYKPNKEILDWNLWNHEPK
jgi:hypothetical protein